MVVLGVALGTIAALVVSLGYYAVAPLPPPTSGAAGSGTRPQPWQIGVEVVRGALTAALLAGLLVAAGWSGAGAGARLGLALALLPVVLLTGSVVWEKVPVKTAVAHMGDWLIKLPAVGAVVGTFV